MAPSDGTHQCPRPGCKARVGRAQYACKGDWFALPKAIRVAIWRGYAQAPNGDAHTEAMEAAGAWYREHPPAQLTLGG